MCTAELKMCLSVKMSGKMFAGHSSRIRNENGALCAASHSSKTKPGEIKLATGLLSQIRSVLLLFAPSGST